MVFPRIGVPVPEGTTPDDGCQHAAAEGRPICGANVDYHLVVEDGQEYGYGIVTLHTCLTHLMPAVMSGVPISVHLAGPQCWGDVDLDELAARGCIPPHVLHPTAEPRVINPKDGS